MGRFGWQEILLVLVILLLLFGAKKLPELARSIGRSLNEFRKGKDGEAEGTVETKSKPEEKPDSKA